MIATKILDPTPVPLEYARRRPRPGEPAWPNAAAGAIALRRRRRPRPCRRTLAAARDILLAVAPQIARQTGRGKSSTCCSAKIATRSAEAATPGADDRPRRPPAVRPARCARRRARAHRPTHVPAVRPMTAAPRRRRRESEGEPGRRARRLARQPRAGANGCSGSKPPSSPPKNPWRARRSSAWSAEACRFDDLIADLIRELRGRPYDLTLVAGGYALPHQNPLRPGDPRRPSRQGRGRGWGPDPDGDVCADRDRVSAAGDAGGDFEARRGARSAATSSPPSSATA